MKTKWRRPRCLKQVTVPSSAVGHHGHGVNMLGDKLPLCQLLLGLTKKQPPNLSVSLMIRKEKNNHSLHKQQQEVPSKVQTTSKVATFHKKVYTES